MGITHVAEIMQLIRKFRSPEEPVAIIQNACTVAQRSVTGDASSICEMVAEAGISSPAVIVVGQVVKQGNTAEILKRAEVNLKLAV